MFRKWIAERQQKKEYERDFQVRQGKKRIQRYIDQQRQMEQKLWALGKQALKLGDNAQFQMVGKQIIWTQNDITRWQRYLLSLETLEARRDQARMTGDFMQSLKAMSESLLVGIDSASLVDIEKNIDAGLERVKDLEDRMDLFMEMAEYTLVDIDRADRHRLNDLQSAMRQEAELDEANSFDAQIAAGLEKIRREMSKEA
jgi:hypothetical protein